MKKNLFEWNLIIPILLLSSIVCKNSHSHDAPAPIYQSGPNTVTVLATAIQDENGTQISPSTIDLLTPTTTKGDLLVEDGSNVVRFPVCADNLLLQGSTVTTSGWGCAPDGGGGGISNVVEDTTPQLGGQLDVNTFSLGLFPCPSIPD